MNFLIWDSGGSAVESAIAIAKEDNPVKYFTPWANGNPKFTAFAPGLGMEDLGIETIYSFFEFISWSDCIVFTDTGWGDVADYVKKYSGKPVFSAGWKGEQMEHDRWEMKKLQKKLGLPIQGVTKITGVSNLAKFLKEHDNEHVKIDIFRGDIESFPSKKYEIVEVYLDEIRHKFGPFAEDYDFIVEDNVDGIELGWDLFFNGIDFIKPYSWGSSGSTFSYGGKYSETMPKPLTMIADKLRPYLQSIDYRGHMSIEVIIDKKGIPYLLDITARLPFPMSNLYGETIKNYSELIYKVASKQPVTIKPIAPYIASLSVETEFGKKNWVDLSFDEKLRKNVKTYISARKDSKWYGVPGNEIVYILLGWGSSLLEANDKINQLLPEIDAFKLVKQSNDLDTIKEILDQTEKYGIGKF